MPKRYPKAPGRAWVKKRPYKLDKTGWPDPPMVPSYALRRCEEACTIEEVRAIVARFLTPRKSPCQERDAADHRGDI